MPAVIGIDLGTTYSCIGVWKDETVEIVPNEEGNRITPSCVSFFDGPQLTGDSAKDQYNVNPRHTISNVKRLIGRKFEDLEVQSEISRLPFAVVDRVGKPVIQDNLDGETKELTPVEVSALVLLKMKHAAETYIGDEVKDAVITVPAHFNDSQRMDTKDAGISAGFNVLRVINEPTAAAIAYHLGEPVEAEERRAIIFDLGGRTFDLTLLSIDEGIYEIITTYGDTHLGGEDFNDRLVDHFVRDFKQINGKNLSGDAQALHHLRSACEHAKRALSSTTHTTLNIESIYEGVDFNAPITRVKFEELCDDLFNRIIPPLEKLLQDSKVDKSDIREIVLTGGSTRIPRIVDIVTNFFDGKKPKNSINPEEAVAHGATIQASILSGPAGHFEIMCADWLLLSLGIETAGGVFYPLIRRNTFLSPQHFTKKSEIFSTYADNQTTMTIRVFEGQRFLTKDNNLLGQFELSGILLAGRGVAQVEVVFEVNVDGLLVVTAIDKETGESKHLSFTSGWVRNSKEDIERIVIDAEEHAAEDEAAAALVTRSQIHGSFDPQRTIQP